MKDYGKEFLDEVASIVQSYIGMARAMIEQRWSAMTDIEGNAEVASSDLPKAQNIVSRCILAYGQKAWIAEYGKGSLMDNISENPYLEDYMHDANFNSERPRYDNAVLGRPRGAYKDLDGNEYYSSGNLDGMIIEDFVNKFGQYLYKPIPARHVIKQVLMDILPEMREEVQYAARKTLNRLIQEFPKEIKLYAE